MERTRPLRVLHIIDTLGGGGSERLVWDIVRLSNPARVKHRVVTIFREGYLATPVYAEPLRQLGAYSRSDATAQRENINAAPLRRRASNLPPALKSPLLPLWNFAFSQWRRVKHAAQHVPSMISIPAEFFRFKPDVVHTHGFYGFKYGLLFKNLFHRPMVHIVPALFSQMEAQGTGWLVNRYRRFHRSVDCFALDA